jgi:hypothetical protein
MNAKDKKVIEDNPNKTLYELLDLGLSDKGFEEASSIFALKTNIPQSNELVPSAVVALPHHAQPHLSQQSIISDDTVQVLNVGRGTIVTMTRKVAERWTQRHPQDYKIV